MSTIPQGQMVPSSTHRFPTGAFVLHWTQMFTPLSLLTLLWPKQVYALAGNRCIEGLSRQTAGGRQNGRQQTDEGLTCYHSALSTLGHKSHGVSHPPSPLSPPAETPFILPALKPNLLCSHVLILHKYCA